MVAPAESGNPLLTVVITAYSRRQYLREAVASVLRQTIPRDSYEILVVKNFSDESIDTFLRQNHVHAFVGGEERMGSYLCKALRAGQGKVVCFLEDDDIWHPKKLASVLQAFETPDVVYYHDSHLPVDSSGRPFRAFLYKRPSESFIVRGRRASTKLLRRAIRTRGDINLSSMSVLREILTEERLQSLAQIPTGPDWFVFFTALDSGRSLLFGNSVLTYYRVHDSAVNARYLSSDAFIDKRRQLMLREIESLRIQKTAFDSEAVQNLIEMRTATDLVQAGILRSPGTDTPESIGPRARDLPHVRKDAYGLTLTSLYLLSFFSWNTSKRIYRWLYLRASLGD